MRSIIVFLVSLLFSVLHAQNEYNKLDAKGLKHGLWKGVYEESKRPRYQGTFEHGKEVGVFQFFDDTQKGDVIATREFNPKDNSAYTIFYDQNKNKVSEGRVVNKLFEGEWKYYHYASPAVMTTENYKNGKLEGVRTVYFLNGKVAEQINYVNNLKQGAYKKYTESGIVLEESFFKNNEYDGLAIFRNDSGTVVAKGMFTKGLKTGIWEVLENGKLVKKSSTDLSQKSKISSTK
ncbi:toxin-antitoxin system YwqK family antitoxin [Flavobacterium sp.]|uniref:toxin-antitoxin system YwqK family antitoxin n=1 Tax=Flavobacterium sp. TaxID=239 RepID=UPI0035ADC2FB